MAKRSNARLTPRGSVRIIGGEWRGRRLTIAENTSVRPTPDRVRETLFNWLRDDVAGARCLDLYAGTGALGFESLSRGAAEAWFVERDPALIAALTAQAETFGATPRIIRRDAASLLREAAPQKFDIVFLDPPYAEPIEPLLELLPAWMSPQGLAYVERPLPTGLPELRSGRWHKRSHAGAVEYGLLRYDPD
jgi:16S rRNA (guanine966-N2)-methyltransferase